MKSLSNFIYLVLISSFFFVVISFAQKSQKEVLVEKKKVIEKEIELTNKLLEDTRRKKTSTLGELKLLQVKINKRSTLIQRLTDEIDNLTSEIEKNTKTLKSLENDLFNAKKEYSDLIFHAFKNRNSQLNFMYLLASDNFNQAYARFLYLQEYKKYRSEKIRLIIILKSVIAEKIQKLALKKEDKQNKINLILGERKFLVGESEENTLLIKRLKQDENQLLQELEKKKKEAEALEKAIEELIKKEVKKNTKELMSPSDKLLSGDFEKNINKLPWPVNQGVIIGKFGEHPHPVLKEVVVRNNGIDFATVKGADVRTVFDGTVSKVFSIKGANSTIMIRHGNYYSVYHNVINVSVKAGDVVKTKQIIGKVSSDAATGESSVHFEIWKGLEILNPELWLSN